MARRKSYWWPYRGLNLKLSPRQREIGGLLLIAVALVTLLGLFSASRGMVIDLWVRVLRRLFGWGAYPVALGLGLAGGTLFLKSRRRQPEVRWLVVIGWEVAFIALLALLHMLSFPPDPQALAAAGEGGGWVGWALSQLLIRGLGRLVAALLLLAIGGVGLGLALQLSWPRVCEALAGPIRALQQWRASRAAAPVTAPGPLPRSEGERPPAPVLRPSLRRRGPLPSLQPEGDLPPLELLDDRPSEPFSEVEVQRRARVIEETLGSFGVPARVVDIKQGPVVTQFGVEPGFLELRGGEQRKVRVSKIASLRNDLALALAAAPIRIEAPVPGRHVVGIEVPNGQTSLVSLRGVMASQAFEEIESPLRIALGRDVSGSPIVTDLGAMPHLLIAGATGSGKSVCINSIVTCLLCQNSPPTLRLVMIDPKRVELLRFNGLPHLIGTVETDVERVVGVLKWLTRQMDDRYRRLADIGARSMEGYNRRVAANGGQAMPYIILIIDELADLMMMAPDEMERLICRLAQMSRATGIHLVIATQRPSVDVVTGLIKANFPARISFAVTSQVDSRVILDAAGAETLLGSGDMLFMAPDSAKLVRIQGCLVSDGEIERVVRFWKMAAPEKIPTPEEAPWKGEPEVGAELDPLIEDAIRVVREHKRASASFLQRRMRIGYPRAARLVDQLEELGVVGPAQDGGRSREVLKEADSRLEQADRDLEGLDH